MIFSFPLQNEPIYGYYRRLSESLANLPPLEGVAILPVNSFSFYPQNNEDCSSINIGVYSPDDSFITTNIINSKFVWDMLIVPSSKIKQELELFEITTVIKVFSIYNDPKIEADELYEIITSTFPPKIPVSVFTFNKRGVYFAELELYDAALSSYRSALCLEPLNPETYNCLGNLMEKQGRHGEAILYFDKAISFDKRFMAAFFNKAGALKEMGGFEDAIDSYHKALQINPDFATGWLNLAVAYALHKQGDKSNNCFKKTIELDPKNTDALFLWGNQLLEEGELEKAIELYKNVLDIDPNHYLSLNSLGIAYLTLMDAENGYSVLKKALEIKPDMTSAMTNIGTACRDLERLREAISWYEKALSIEPDNPDTHWNYSLALLHIGDYTRGWKEYEWRFKKSDRLAIRPCSLPLWDGGSLDGKTIIIQAEQGYGDTIQFMRYVPLVIAKGGRVIVECQDDVIKPLLELIPGTAGVISCLEEQPPADLRIPLLSLPLIFETTAETILFSAGYVKPTIQMVEHWQLMLDYGERTSKTLKIGFVWDGRKTFRNDKRSIELEKIIPLFEIEGITFISLQKGEQSEQLKSFITKYNILDITEQLFTFADTAALIANLDLVISVDTSVAHLAGAVGIPTYIMLKTGPDWRWLGNRIDSPWYSSVKLYRQNHDGNWNAVIKQIQTDLKNKLG